MTKRRKAANPIFKVPLTYAELRGPRELGSIDISPAPKGTQVVCTRCKGGGARGLRKIAEGTRDSKAVYRCNDHEICERRQEMLAMRRIKVDKET